MSARLVLLRLHATATAAFMRLLVDHGADPNINTEVGVTPLWRLRSRLLRRGKPGPLTGVPEAERLEAVKLALELGNPINAHTNFGNYPMIGSAGSYVAFLPAQHDDLLNLGVGDPRWNGMTALHGAVLSNQPSLRPVPCRPRLGRQRQEHAGWTPLMETKGIFMRNSRKEFPSRRDPEKGPGRKRPARFELKLSTYRLSGVGAFVFAADEFDQVPCRA